MLVRTLYNMNCVMACLSSCYTIYTILCNVLTLGYRTSAFRLRAARKCLQEPSVVVTSLPANTLFAPSIYSPLLLLNARWSLRRNFHRKLQRNKIESIY